MLQQQVQLQLYNNTLQQLFFLQQQCNNNTVYTNPILTAYEGITGEY